MTEPIEEQQANRHVARLFVVLAILFGTIFAIITPPFQTPDEPAHFFRAVATSRGDFFTVKTASERGVYLPQWSIELATRLLDGLPGRAWAKTSTATILAAARASGRSARPLFVRVPPAGTIDRLGYSAAPYVPAPYLASAAALGLGELLELPPLARFYMGRLANLLLAIVLIWWAITIIPFGKWVVTLLALTPMSLHLLASYSADSLTLAAAFLLTAIAIRATKRVERMTPGEASAVIGSAFLALVAKPTGNLVLLIPFAVPTLRFRSWLQRWMFLGFHVLTLVAAVGVIAYWSHDGIQTAPLNISPARQLQFITHHPIQFAGVLVRTYLEYGQRYFAELIGKLGWMELYLPIPLILSYYFALFYAARTEVSVLSVRERLALVFLFFGSVLAVAVMLYCTGLPVAAPLIDGLQGRYFLPMAPLLFLAIAGPKVANVSTRQQTIRLGGYLTAALTVTAICISRRYYNW